MSIELRAASTVPFEAYVDAFNESYQGYFTPIELTPLSMQRLIERDAIDLTASVAAMDGDRIVGIAMLAIRSPRAWVGGVGVIAAYRRRGIARQMMRHLIEQGRQRQLDVIELEVIDQNIGAYTLYSALGFEKRRKLLIVERAPQYEAIPPINGYRITPTTPQQALRYFHNFHDVPNPWQRDIYALEALAPYLNGWLIAAEGTPDTILGYGIGVTTLEHVRMMDLAIAPDAPDRGEVAHALLSEFHHTHPTAIGNMINVGDNDVVVAPLKALGYQTILAQYEMRLAL